MGFQEFGLDLSILSAGLKRLLLWQLWVSYGVDKQCIRCS